MANIAAKLSLNVPAITALCKGQPGTSLLNGVGAPTAGLGLSGDFYLDTATYFIYGPKTTVWPSGVQLTYGSLSGKWDASYSTLNTLSGSWNSTNTTVYSLSNNWNAVYSTVRAYSAANWETAYYQSNSIFSYLQTVTGGFSNTKDRADNTFTAVNGNSSRWESVYSSYNGASASWLNGFNRTMSVFQTVSSLSASWGATAGAIAYTVLVGSSADWDSTHTSVYDNSARWENAWTTSNAASANLNEIRPLSGRWNSVFNSFSALSADYKSVNSTVYTYSAGWGGQNIASVVTIVQQSSADWNDTHTWFNVYSAVTDNRITTLENDIVPLQDFQFRTYNVIRVPIISNTLTLDINEARTFFTIVSADINTININNPQDGDNTFTLLMSSNGTTYNVTWPSRISWPNNQVPVRTTAVNRTDIFSFMSVNSGQKYFGTFVGSAHP
jgi:hypothetical protein